MRGQYDRLANSVLGAQFLKVPTSYKRRMRFAGAAAATLMAITLGGTSAARARAMPVSATVRVASCSIKEKVEDAILDSRTAHLPLDHDSAAAAFLQRAAALSKADRDRIGKQLKVERAHGAIDDNSDVVYRLIQKACRLSEWISAFNAINEYFAAFALDPSNIMRESDDGMKFGDDLGYALMAVEARGIASPGTVRRLYGAYTLAIPLSSLPNVYHTREMDGTPVNVATVARPQHSTPSSNRQVSHVNVSTRAPVNRTLHASPMPLPPSIPPRTVGVSAAAPRPVAIAVASHATTAPEPSPSPLSSRSWTMAAPNAILELAVLTSLEQMERGLSGRASLPPHTGAVFVFAGDAPRTFSTKNVPFNVDLVFIARDGTVTGISTLAGSRYGTPDAEVPNITGYACYVIAINGGEALRDGFENGMHLDALVLLRDG